MKNLLFLNNNNLLQHQIFQTTYNFFNKKTISNKKNNCSNHEKEKKISYENFKENNFLKENTLYLQKQLNRKNNFQNISLQEIEKCKKKLLQFKKNTANERTISSNNNKNQQKKTKYNNINFSNKKKVNITVHNAKYTKQYNINNKKNILFNEKKNNIFFFKEDNIFNKKRKKDLRLKNTISIKKNYIYNDSYDIKTTQLKTKKNVNIIEPNFTSQEKSWKKMIEKQLSIANLKQEKETKLFVNVKSFGKIFIKIQIDNKLAILNFYSHNFKNKKIFFLEFPKLQETFKTHGLSLKFSNNEQHNTTKNFFFKKNKNNKKNNYNSFQERKKSNIKISHYNNYFDIKENNNIFHFFV